MFLSHTLPLHYANVYWCIIVVAGSIVHPSNSCPNNIHWSEDSLEKDLYINTTTVTILAMDGRRRWLDIQKLVSFINVPFMILNKFKIVPLNCFKLLMFGVIFNMCSLLYKWLLVPGQIENGKSGRSIV